MRRRSLHPTLLLTLPCALIFLFGFAVTRWREAEHRNLIEWHSYPFKSELQLTRGLVPPAEVPGSFEVKANYKSSGGSGLSQWFVRGVLISVSKNSSREIWNSQKLLDSSAISEAYRGSGSLASTMSATRGIGPSQSTDSYWRFERKEGARQLKMFVEAVAFPLPVAERELGSSQVSVKEGTVSQIALAKAQTGARYFYKSIDLYARDDAKFTFTGDELSN